MFGPVDYKAETTANFSKNSPKLRFTAITYLLENGFYQAGQGNDLIEEAQRICDFVTANVEEFLAEDRKSTRLNSSHVKISYAVFCLKKKTERVHRYLRRCA